MEEKKVTAAEPQVPQNVADEEQVTVVELEPVKSSSIAKFVIASVVGVFLFLPGRQSASRNRSYRR